MKNISILVPEGALAQGITDPAYLFSQVNQFLIHMQKEPLFEVQLVGAKKEVKLNNDSFSIHPDKRLGEVKNRSYIYSSIVWRYESRYKKK